MTIIRKNDGCVVTKDVLIRQDKEGVKEVHFHVSHYRSKEELIETLQETINFLQRDDIKKKGVVMEMTDCDEKTTGVAYAGNNKYCIL